MSNTALAVFVPLLIALFAGQTFWIARSLDGLQTGIGERLDRIEHRLDRIEDLLRDHDRRITRLEGAS